jgi:outer membrane lipoprotein SlyB
MAAGVSNAGGAAFSSGAWMFSSIIYTARTGIDYKKYKKGQITKETFQRNAKMGAFGVAGGLGGASGGGAAGFAIGTAIFPGVGSAIGAIAGAIGGGIAGNKISTKIYERMEERMTKLKLER